MDKVLIDYRPSIWWHKLIFSALCAFFIFSANPSGAQSTDSEASANDSSEGRTVKPYDVKFDGLEDSDLKTLLTRASKLEELREDADISPGRLRRRAEGDLENLARVLRSEGYYDAELAYEIDRTSEDTTVTINVSLGTVYRLASYDISYVEPLNSEVGADINDLEPLGLEIGMPAAAAALVAAQNALLRRLGERGYPLADVANRRAAITRDSQSMTVEVLVDPGPYARFGALSFEGLQTVEPDYLNQTFQWETGAVYDRRTLDDLRRAILETNLFSTISISPPKEPDENGQIPVNVTLGERKHRSIGAGVSYSTAEGLGAEAFWQHRNLFGSGERLGVTLNLSQIRQSLEGNFRKPAFLQSGQSLLLDGKLLREESDAFDELSAATFIGLERILTPTWTVSGGGSMEYSRLKDNTGVNKFLLFGLPLTATRDTRDDVLEPTKGTRLRLATSPYSGIGGIDPVFLRTDVEGSVYYAPLETARLILAARTRFGTIVGEATDDVPSNKRFYSGGGGSIRGYDFQAVGPLDLRNAPLGGRSVFEVGFETRIRITDSLGLVPFVEGGNVYDDELPDFSEEMRWAAGLGFRYFTPVGPLRVDFAFPLNRRPSDDSFQFYVSIGQAF